MHDDQAEAIAEAGIHLACVIRDEGPDAVTQAARAVLAAADGDPLAALSVLAALVPVNRPLDIWWRRPIVQPRPVPRWDLPLISELKQVCAAARDQREREYAETGLLAVEDMRRDAMGAA